MITSQEYRERIKALRPNVYIDGELVSRDDPRIEPGMNVIALTYDLPQEKKHEDLFTATSHLTGEKINRFCHVHRSTDDLMKKQEMTRLYCHKSGGCIQRCMGIDAVNALSVMTYEIDQVHQTEYHQRFLAYLEYFQENDLCANCAQTDVKGDRKKRPHQPADAEGVKLICRPTAFRPRKLLDAPIAHFGDVESLTIFDDVFVPWERVFMCGEQEFGGPLALLFALYHRHSYTGCKPATSDVLMGMAALVAEYNGIEDEKHVQQKLADMISVAELVYAAGIAAAVKGQQAPSGTYVPEVIYSNVGRRHAGENIYHEFEIVADLAGGLSATLPLEGDFLSEETGPLLAKYMMRNPNISAEDQHRCFRMISDVICSSMGGVSQIAGLHGGGSPVMETITVLRNYNLEAKKRIAKDLAGIKS